MHGRKILCRSAPLGWYLPLKGGVQLRDKRFHTVGGGTLNLKEKPLLLLGCAGIVDAGGFGIFPQERSESHRGGNAAVHQKSPLKAVCRFWKNLYRTGFAPGWKNVRPVLWEEVRRRQKIQSLIRKSKEKTGRPGSRYVSYSGKTRPAPARDLRMPYSTRRR